MRILLVDQFSEAGGAQRALLEAAEGFAKRGWELHAALPEGPVARILATFCRSVTPLACGPFTSVRKGWADVARFGFQLPGQIAAISRVVQHEQIDLLYVTGPRVALAASLGRRGRPMIYHAHSIVTQTLAAQVTGYALRAPGMTLLASSRFVARWLKPIARGAAVQVVYNGAAGFGVRPKPPQRSLRIAMLGRIAPEKGQLAFARAARLVHNRNPELTFVIGGAPMFGGTAYAEAVRAEAGDAVSFEGWIDNLGDFLRQVDLLVVPSAPVDANPRVIPEAYAAGVPVLAFNVGGIPELIDHGITGLLVSEHTPEALAGAIRSALDDPMRLAALAERAYARWHRCYTLERFQSELCDAADGAAGRRRIAAGKARASATA